MYKYAGIFALASLSVAAGAIIADESGPVSPEKPTFAQTVSLPVAPKVTAISADPSGHFSVATLVNGTHVNMIADTGATFVVLTEEDARRAGIEPGWLDYNVPVQTANGQSMTARVVLDEIRVGGIIIRNVDALVAQPLTLQKSLLGMSFIGSLQRFELKGDQLVLYQ